MSGEMQLAVVSYDYNTAVALTLLMQNAFACQNSIFKLGTVKKQSIVVLHVFVQPCPVEKGKSISDWDQPVLQPA